MNFNNDFMVFQSFIIKVLDEGDFFGLGVIVYRQPVTLIIQMLRFLVFRCMGSPIYDPV